MIAPSPDHGFFPVRPTAASAELLAVLHAACFDDAWNAPSMIQVRAMPGTFGTIAVVNDPGSAAVAPAEAGAKTAAGLPVGFVLWRTVADEGEVLTICILPEWRGHGIAAALLENAIEEVAEKGVRSVFLEVSESNAPAIGLYKRCGFSAVGCRTGYYRRAKGGREAALIMRRDLAADS